MPFTPPVQKAAPVLSVVAQMHVDLSEEMIRQYEDEQDIEGGYSISEFLLQQPSKSLLQISPAQLIRP